MPAALATTAVAGSQDWLKKKEPAPLPPLVLSQPSPPEIIPEGSVMRLESERKLPARFRSSEQYSPNEDRPDPTMAGMTGLRASGSGNFCRDQLYALQEKLAGRSVVVIDLRAEPHGMINNCAVTWAKDPAWKITRANVEAMESNWLKRAMELRRVTTSFYAPGRYADRSSWQEVALIFDVRSVLTPEQLIVRSRWNYRRVPVNDGEIPTDEVVDDFFRTLRGLEESDWKHLHCDTGGYRTSLFLTLYDMSKNFNRASKGDIIARQRRLGGIDLTKDPKVRKFLSDFFSYCWQAGPEFNRSFAAWRRSQ